jgi:predicted MFS family arabinose efflux permease
LFIFLVGILGALEAPAWQAIVPLLVPNQALSSASAANSVGINISRVIGPALAGFVILALGIAAPFWLDAISNLGVIAVIYWWRPPAKANTLPAERLLNAVRTGVRYARNNTHLRATLVQAAGFFLFASSYWALLPVLARSQLHGTPTLYGVLLGAIGAGGLAGASLLPRLKSSRGPNGMVAIGEVGTAVALVLFGLAHNALTAILACLIAGLSWILVLATLNVSAQVALPEWVRGRGLAAYVTVFFGTMSVGSLIWGFIAERVGLPSTQFIAAAGVLIAIAVTRSSKLQTGLETDLTPSMHWPVPVLAKPVKDDAGPVLVTVEYLVASEMRDAFLAVLGRVARERKRDGAYAWNIYEDTAFPERVLETFLVDSWVEHLRQHQRVTNADRVVEEHVRKLVRDEPRITHYISARRTAGAE